LWDVTRLAPIIGELLVSLVRESFTIHIFCAGFSQPELPAPEEAADFRVTRPFPGSTGVLAGLFNPAK
jgi:hypothetical protein